MLTCLQCGEPAEVKFCSRSCAGKYNGKRRVRTEESKGKTAKAVQAYLLSIGKVRKVKPSLNLEPNNLVPDLTYTRNLGTCTSLSPARTAAQK